MVPASISIPVPQSRRRTFPAFPHLSQEPANWIVIIVNNALFQRNDRVVCNMNVFGADFRATFCDVTKADSELFLHQLSPIQAVERVHLQAGYANEKAWTTKVLFLVMIPQHMADVLTEEALDTFTELLDAVDIALVHLPLNIRARRERRNFPIDSVIPGYVCN